MKLRSLAAMLLILLCACRGHSPAVKNVVAKTIDGADFSMNETANNFASVFVFLLPDCPASQKYSGTLNQFSEKYKSNNIRFYGVFPSFVKKDEIEEFQKIYYVMFSLLMDDEKKLLQKLHARIAPEAFVLDQDDGLLYSGRIDNWMYAVGQERTVITTHELQDALDAIISGKKIDVAKTQAVGCIID